MIGTLLLALAVQQAAIPAGTPATAWRPAPSGSVVSRPLTDTIHALAERVEIVRTAYGVPHILADDLKAMGFGLGYVQSEDYSVSIAVGMIASRGTLARHLARTNSTPTSSPVMSTPAPSRPSTAWTRAPAMCIKASRKASTTTSVFTPTSSRPG